MLRTKTSLWNLLPSWANNNKMETTNSDTMRGFLYKWTNYLKGYQKRWFVLQDGFVSYYRNQAEMAHTCRGTINLVNATIEATGLTTFIISNSSNQTFHLRAANENDKKKWVTTLLSAKSKSAHLTNSGEDSDTCFDGDDYGEYKITSLTPDEAVHLVTQTMVKLESHLSDLQRHHETLTRKSSELQRSIAEMESARDPSEMTQHFQTTLDRMTVFKVVSLAMVSSCTDFITLSRGQVQRWRRVFNSQHERCALLEQMIEELAKQLRQLELLVKQKNPQVSLTLAGSDAALRDGTYSSNHDSSANFVPSFPGQAVRIGQNHTQQREDTSSSQKSYPEQASEGSVSDQPTKIPAPTISQPTDEASLDSSDDDFYDAVDIETEFSVFLPPSPPVQKHVTGKRLQTKSPSDDASLKDDDTSSTCPQDDDSQIGTEVAYEYESDIDFPAEDDIYHGPRSRRSRGLREAQVICTRQQEASRTGTLVPETKPQSEQISLGSIIPKRETLLTRRTSIPFKPNYSLNLWSIMKNCIGKELTKMPMPVNFSEPLSMLQRLTEDFEYSTCLDDAARCTDTLEQMVHVAAFTVSSYATTAVRVNKPFNPLLGETYECDRTDDLGWRSLAEQVSHHPPKCALHCESDSWYCWFDFSMSTQFRGKYLKINPIGTCHLVFRRTGHHYTWQKIPMTVNNIIIGRLWIDNSGEMDIINHQTGEKCHLSYKAYSYFSSDAPRRVTGAVTDKSGNVQYVLDGSWDEFMEYSPVINTRRTRNGKPVLETGPSQVIWRRNPLPSDADRMYFFTALALQLNEEEEGVCPTDSRFRPDQRLMELGRWDEANREKVVLEEKQRSRRRQAAAQLASEAFKNSNHEDSASLNSDSNGLSSSNNKMMSPPAISDFLDVVDNAHKPLWFERHIDSDTGTSTFRFTGNYWDCKTQRDWSMCPDIY